MAPKGSSTLSDWDGQESVDCSVLLPRGAQVFAKMASENGVMRVVALSGNPARQGAGHERGVTKVQTRGNG